MPRTGVVASSDGATRKPLPAAADVVIVGGGCMGASTAFHLAEAGVSVVLVERDEIASGSTARAAGGVRAQFSDETNIRLGLRSLDLFERFATRPGADIELDQTGYLFTLSTPEDVATFERTVALQNSLGVPSRMIDAAEVRRRCPPFTGGDVLAGCFYERDGHCTPEAATTGYASAARALGAHVARHTTVTGIERTAGAVSGVVTDRGTIRTSQVLVTAGAWSRAVGAMAGVDLPVTPVRRQIVVTEPIAGLDPHLPFTLDYSTTFYFHNEGPGLLFGYSDKGEEPGFDQEPTDAFLEGLADHIEHFVPELGGIGIAAHWGGLYEETPDHNALIGASSEVPGLFYACGFSGHGFLESPAVGETMRDLITGRTPDIDVSTMTADRFATDELVPELNCI